MTTLPPSAVRITRRLYAETAADALSGAGGIFAGGRWHSMGSPIVYAAESCALAQLERLVHGDEQLAERNGDLVRFRILLPRIRYHLVSAEQLTRNDPLWRFEGNDTCRRIGDEWLRRRESCVLLVPSAVSPSEWIVLLNPEHADLQLVLAANKDWSTQPLEPDARVVRMVSLYRRYTA